MTNTPIVLTTNSADPSAQHASDSRLESPAAGQSSPRLQPPHLSKACFCCKVIYYKTWRKKHSHPSLLEAQPQHLASQGRWQHRRGVRRHGEASPLLVEELAKRGENLIPTSTPTLQIPLVFSFGRDFALTLTAFVNPTPASPLSPAWWT